MQEAAAWRNNPAIQPLAAGVSAPSGPGMNRFRPSASARDWWICQPLLAAFGSLGRAMKEARSPSRWQTSFAMVRKLTAMSAIVMGSAWEKVNSNWFGPISISTLRTGMPMDCAARRSLSRIASASP